MSCLPKYNGSTDFHVFSDSICQQMISSTYHNCWLQCAYASGRHASCLENLRMCGKSGPVLQAHVQKTAGTLLHEKVVFSEYYWHDAVHIWLPNMSSARCMSASAIHPCHSLPGLFICGEAFSLVQGWQEGAMQTALTAARMASQKDSINPPLATIIPQKYVIYKGQRIDVSKWMHVHPGGARAIQNHLFEDVTSLFDFIHLQYAHSVLFSLSVA